MKSQNEELNATIDGLLERLQKQTRELLNLQPTAANPSAVTTSSVERADIVSVDERRLLNKQLDDLRNQLSDAHRTIITYAKARRVLIQKGKYAKETACQWMQHYDLHIQECKYPESRRPREPSPGGFLERLESRPSNN